MLLLQRVKVPCLADDHSTPPGWFIGYSIRTAKRKYFYLATPSFWKTNITIFFLNHITGHSFPSFSQLVCSLSIQSLTVKSFRNNYFWKENDKGNSYVVTFLLSLTILPLELKNLMLANSNGYLPFCEPLEQRVLLANRTKFYFCIWALGLSCISTAGAGLHWMGNEFRLSLPNSMLHFLTLVPWSFAQWECLHHGNW